MRAGEVVLVGPAVARLLAKRGNLRIMKRLGAERKYLGMRRARNGAARLKWRPVNGGGVSAVPVSRRWRCLLLR